MKYWEIIADNLSKAGWGWGCVAAVDSRGRTIFVANAHRGRNGSASSQMRFRAQKSSEPLPMDRFAEFVIQFFTRYGQTVILARLITECAWSMTSDKNMRSDMVPVDSAQPAVESISNGAPSEVKWIAGSVGERRCRVCRLGPRTENAGSWKCTWCGHANVRERAGLDHCSVCNAEVLTYFTGMENELLVRYSRPPLRLSDSAAARFTFSRRPIELQQQIETLTAGSPESERSV
jgi:hypothetical protein